MELPDDPTIISIVGVTLVEDAVTASSALVTLGAVPMMVLLVGLRHEDSSLLALGVLRLGLWKRRLRQIVREEPPFFGPRAPIGYLEEPDHEVSLSFTESFSFILMSMMPVENAEMTSSLEIQGILFCTWLKCWMYG
jgi:hypothetical protein